MKNWNIKRFLTVWLLSALLCLLSGYTPIGGILLSPVVIALLALVLAEAPPVAIPVVFWMLPLTCLAGTGFFFGGFLTVFVTIVFFLSASVLYLCYQKKANRTFSVSIVAVAIGFSALVLIMYALLVWTKGDLSRESLSGLVDRFTRWLTKVIKGAYEKTETETDFDTLVSVLVQGLIASLPGYLCAASAFAAYFSTGLFRTVLQKKDAFAYTWEYKLSPISSTVFVLVLVVSFFVSNETLRYGLNNVASLMQMLMALAGFCYFRYICRSKKIPLIRYYGMVAGIFVAAPIVGYILASVSKDSALLAGFLLSLPSYGYVIMYIGGFFGVANQNRKYKL
ncbi:MAG TPA: hypothetical protein DCY75_02455 [Clostridiales bacterium]|nr:hypothetical protein [Clostridiales bacterium]